jgi:hypothetical protein
MSTAEKAIAVAILLGSERRPDRVSSVEIRQFIDLVEKIEKEVLAYNNDRR